jgi:hypothetical protein
MQTYAGIEVRRLPSVEPDLRQFVDGHKALWRGREPAVTAKDIMPTQADLRAYVDKRLSELTRRS